MQNPNEITLEEMMIYTSAGVKAILNDGKVVNIVIENDIDI